MAESTFHAAESIEHSSHVEGHGFSRADQDL
jgi:hypothetical protein